MPVSAISNLTTRTCRRPRPRSSKSAKWRCLTCLEDNTFVLPARDERVAPAGPYRRWSVDPRQTAGVRCEHRSCEKAAEFHLSLGPFRQVVKDYFQICESYFDAVKTLPPSQIETIDMARRGIHNEGSRVLQERLEGKAEIDIDTARRLFTLICVLHFGG